MNKSIKMLFMTIILTGLIVGGASFAQSEPVIDIGLIFGGNNEYPIGISTNTGIEIVRIHNGIEESLVGLPSLNAFKIFKLGYYKMGASGQQLIEVPESYYVNGQVKGAYRIRTGLSFTDYQSADAIVSSMDNSFYVSYDGSWQIDYGHFLSESEAIGKLEEVKTLIPESNPMVIKGTAKEIAFGTDLETMLVLDTSVDFLFKTELFEVGNSVYRYGFKIKRLPDSDFTLINHLPLEQYLYGVVPKEMNGEWPLEALKAQAIAARNYAVKNMGKYDAYEFDLCSTVKSQVYGGYSVEKPQSNLAVDLTRGLLLTYNGEIADCYYHSHSGGATDSVENIWSTPLPYIKAVEDVFSVASGAPVTDWTLQLTSGEIEQRLIQAGYNIGRLSKIRILERTKSGRVTTMQFVGSFSTATLTKESPRFVLGTTVLKSMNFGFDASKAVSVIPTSLPRPDVVSMPRIILSSEGIYGEYASSGTIRLVTSRGIFETRLNPSIPNIPPPTSSNHIQVYEETDASRGYVVFYGHGYGHGLGMSQWGAKKMAELGFDFNDILEHYYKDTQITRYYNE